MNINEIYTAHGNFMDWVMSKEDIACFLDADCLPHDKESIKQAYDRALENRSSFVICTKFWS
jgi:hypothetical protein